MKDKYSIVQITEIIVWPITAKNPTNDQKALGEYLAKGYGIYKAIEFHTNEVAGIKYILRKENYESKTT